MMPSLHGSPMAGTGVIQARIAELFKLLSSISGEWCGGAIPLMVAIIISVVFGQPSHPTWWNLFWDNIPVHDESIVCKPTMIWMLCICLQHEPVIAMELYSTK